VADCATWRGIAASVCACPTLKPLQGHAGANIVPVIASNRVGREGTADDPSAVTFYGTSFITDFTGDVLAEADRETPGVLTASFDLDEIAGYRAGWGLFRDRRPELYRPLTTLDGKGLTVSLHR